MSRSLLIVFSLIVSFLAISPAVADDFSIFEDELSLDEEANPTPPSPPEDPSKKVERLKSEFRKDSKNYNKLVSLAEALVENKDLNNAKKILWKYVDKIPTKGMYLLSDVHLSQKENEKALKVANLAVVKNEKDHRAWALVGKAQLAMQKDQLAIEAFNKAITLKPDFEEAYLPVLEHYRKRKNTYEIRILLQDMIKSIGPRPQYLTQLCQINTDDKTYEQALGVCRDAINKDKSIADNHTNLGLCQYYSRDPELGLKTIEVAANNFPKSDYAQLQYAKLLEEKKNYIESLKFYKRAASANEKSGVAWLGIAMSAYELMKYDEALGAFKKACKLDRNIAPHFRKAMITLRNAKNRDWTASYEKASEQCVFGN